MTDQPLMIRGRSVGQAGKALASQRDSLRARADDPYAVSYRCRTGQVPGITRSQGREVVCGALVRAIGPLGFTSSYRPARIPQTRCSAGIAATRRLTVVTRACGARTGFGIVAGTTWGCMNGRFPSGGRPFFVRKRHGSTHQSGCATVCLTMPKTGSTLDIANMAGREDHS